MKLTIHDACWEAAASPWADRALSANVGWIKIIDDPRRAFGVAQTFPDCNVIYRRVAPSDIEQLSDLRRHPEFHEPQACAEMFVRLADVAAANNLWVEGANEARLGDADDAAWFGRVEALRSTLLAQRGLRAVIGNFATGNPGPDLFNVWLEAYLRNGGRSDALIGLHEYGAINLPAAHDLHNLLRHRMLIREAGPLAHGFRWAITECGLDRVQVGGAWVGGGWQAQGASLSQEAYWNFLLDFAGELEQDDEVLCAAVFTYGDTGRWSAYELNEAETFNTLLLDRIASEPVRRLAPIPLAPDPPRPIAPREPSLPTDCERADVPEDWTHTVNAVLGLNVRSEPALGDNKVCALINGKPIRAVTRQGDWVKVDWPVSGWCFAANLVPRPLLEVEHSIAKRPNPRRKKPRTLRQGKAFRLRPGSRFVDVSAWQEPDDLDWQALAWNGCAAAMIRLVVGAQVDLEWQSYARDAQTAGLAWFGYVFYSFTAAWTSQLAALDTVLTRLKVVPTLALDLEGANPQRSDDELRLYIDALAERQVPLALYTRRSWVEENLPHLHALLPDAPLIVANYRYPVNATPALPPGWEHAHAWQHVAGEKVASDGLYWARFKTRSGKYLDESIVLEAGLPIRCGK